MSDLGLKVVIEIKGKNELVGLYSSAVSPEGSIFFVNDKEGQQALRFPGGHPFTKTPRAAIPSGESTGELAVRAIEGGSVEDNNEKIFPFVFGEYELDLAVQRSIICVRRIVFVLGSPDSGLRVRLSSRAKSGLIRVVYLNKTESSDQAISVNGGESFTVPRGGRVEKCLKYTVGKVNRFRASLVRSNVGSESSENDEENIIVGQSGGMDYVEIILDP